MRKQQQQIEEMANCSPCYERYGNCPIKDKTNCNRWTRAVNQYEQGYRKIPKDAVVLLVGEYNQPLDEKTIEYFVNHNQEIRKETAREIFGELQEFVENRKHRFDLECNEAEKVAESYNEDERGREIFTKILHKKDGAWVECDVIELKIDNLAEKYGVEVEE